jgi:hypothetical protein
MCAITFSRTLAGMRDWFPNRCTRTSSQCDERGVAHRCTSYGASCGWSCGTACGDRSLYTGMRRSPHTDYSTALRAGTAREIGVWYCIDKGLLSLLGSVRNRPHLGYYAKRQYQYPSRSCADMTIEFTTINIPLWPCCCLMFLILAICMALLVVRYRVKS